MVNLDTLAGLGIGAIIGSILTALIAWAREHRKTDRQFRFDIIRNRLEVFEKLSNHYLLLASALSEFHQLASIGTGNDERKFYYICKFYFYYSKIAEEAGGFEFENRRSEEVVTHLVGDIIKIFREFKYEAFSDMIDLVSYEDGRIKRYNKFLANIDQKLFSDFQNKIIKNVQNRLKLIQYSKWLEEIIMFEINKALRFWYNESPEFKSDQILIDYLVDKNEEKYIQRLKRSNKSTIQRFFSTKGNY